MHLLLTLTYRDSRLSVAIRTLEAVMEEENGATEWQGLQGFEYVPAVGGQNTIGVIHDGCARKYCLSFP